MLSDPTEPIPVTIWGVLEHMTENVPLSAPPGLSLNFSAYSSGKVLHLDQLIKGRKQEYWFVAWASTVSIYKTHRSVIWPNVSLRKIWYSRIPKFNKNHDNFIVIKHSRSNKQ